MIHWLRVRFGVSKLPRHGGSFIVALSEVLYSKIFVVALYNFENRTLVGYDLDCGRCSEMLRHTLFIL